MWADPLRDVQLRMPAGWCARCGDELYGDEELCARCRTELQEETYVQEEREYIP